MASEFKLRKIFNWQILSEKIKNIEASAGGPTIAYYTHAPDSIYPQDYALSSLDIAATFPSAEKIFINQTQVG